MLKISVSVATRVFFSNDLIMLLQVIKLDLHHLIGVFMWVFVFIIKYAGVFTTIRKGIRSLVEGRTLFL